MTQQQSCRATQIKGHESLQAPFSDELTIGLSYKGKSCILFIASVADATSLKTTQAWPLCLRVLKASTSRIFPNWEKTALRDFLSSARISEIIVSYNKT